MKLPVGQRLSAVFLLLGVIGFPATGMALPEHINGTTTKPLTEPGWHQRSLQVGVKKRWFRVYVPEDMPDNAPALVLLHGGLQSMRMLSQSFSGGAQAWVPIAERDKLLLLVPNGSHAQNGSTRGWRQHWNDLREDGPVAGSGIDDLGFIRRLTEWAQSTYQYDRSRLYVSGASNGGMLSFRLLMEQSDRFAAGAVFIANLPKASRRIKMPQSPRPLMMVNGSADELTPFGGGMMPNNRDELRSAAATVAWWVDAAKADLQSPERWLLDDTHPDDGCRVHAVRFPALPGGAEVLSYCLDGGGHSMPSIQYALPSGRLFKRLLGRQCHDVEGAELAWSFLKKQRIPAPQPSQ